MRRFFNPLPQVHPGKWYPSAGKRPAAVAISDERKQANGARMRFLFALSDDRCGLFGGYLLELKQGRIAFAIPPRKPEGS